MATSWLLLASLSAAAAVHLPEQDEFHFRSWMSQYNKVYSPQEYYERLQIFTDNKRRIDKHNAGNHSFTMRLNQFSDMTFSEFRKSYLLSEPQNCSATKGNYLSSNAPLPDSIDWRKKGNYLTPVKNQVTVGGFLMITGHSEEEERTVWQLLDFLNNGLSGVCGRHWNWEARTTEQQLVDCAQAFNNHGCKGGLPSQAFEYILYNKGLMTETDYPYNAFEGPCRYSPKLAAAFVKDVVNITAYDEMGMVDAVATHNPVSFAFDVTADFMSYHQGVYTSTQCHSTTDMVNHAVLAVGYGQANGIPYWIVKNSWGSSWGMDGYFLIERGKNMCGLAACSSFPVV